jgi:hypothetical protein
VILHTYIHIWGLGWRSGLGAALIVEGYRAQFPEMSLDFSMTYFFPTAPRFLGSNKSLVKISTKNIPGGNGGRWVELITSPHSCAKYHENVGA